MFERTEKWFTTSIFVFRLQGYTLMQTTKHFQGAFSKQTGKNEQAMENDE